LEIAAWLRDLGLERYSQAFLDAAVHNTLNVQRHLVSRRTLRLCRAVAMAQRHVATMAA
jgi:hypothetical protein